MKDNRRLELDQIILILIRLILNSNLQCTIWLVFARTALNCSCYRGTANKETFLCARDMYDIYIEYSLSFSWSIVTKSGTARYRLSRSVGCWCLRSPGRVLSHTDACFQLATLVFISCTVSPISIVYSVIQYVFRRVYYRLWQRRWWLSLS